MVRADLLSFRLWQIGVPCVAAAVGGLAGIEPALGVAAALALVYLALIIQNLALGLGVFLGITFLEGVSGLGDLSLAKAAGGVLLLGWAAAAVTDTGSSRQLIRDHPALSAAILALGAWALSSAFWAELPDVAFSGAQRWVLNLAMIPIVYTAVREPRHVRWIFAIFVGGALASAAIGVAGGVSTETGRLEGSGINANELGILLVVAVVLATALGACRELGPFARAAAFASAGLAVLALLTTASRGALVGMVVAALVAPLLAGPRRRTVVLAAIVLAVAGTASYVTTVAPASFERVTAGDSSGTGRTEIWTIGLRMVQDKPIAGVGADNYGNSTIHYLLQPGGLTRSEFFVDEQKVAHNVYLQALAELGAVGLALFACVLGFALLTLLRAARVFADVGDRSMDLLSRALLIALCGHLAAWTFSSDLYSKQLWLLLGVAIAIGAIARTRAGEPSAA